MVRYLLRGKEAGFHAKTSYGRHGIPVSRLESVLAVWKALQAIPYGSTTTYGELAKQVKTESGAVSPRAVGSAVGHNPILLFVPCHRVIGKDGQLTGYAAGVERKKALLALEKKASK